MKKLRFFLVLSAIGLLLGMTGCKKESSVNIQELEQSLVGIWWDEFEYEDVTEEGVPFSRVLLAVRADADHTGCIYLGVFDDKSDHPLAVYGGHKNAGFTWHLLEDGSLQLTESSAVKSTYGNDMTDVSGTSASYTGGSVTVTNSNYSSTLQKADAGKQEDIEKKVADADWDGALTVEALTDGTVKVVITEETFWGSSAGTLSTGMKYSVNGGAKTLITTSTDIPVSAGDKVQFYGNGTSTQVYGNYPSVRFQGSGEGFKCKAYGNIMSLFDETNFATKTDLPNQPRVFNNLFRENTALTDAGDLLLPATTLASECYCGMFAYCTALETAPALPSTTLATDCYTNMFFRCGALTTAPKLPATTLANSCYYNMFYGCSALETAPDLLATTLVQDCYHGMFQHCTALKSVMCLAKSGINENDSTLEWMEDVAATGTFFLSDSALWPEGVNGIPGGWTGKYPNVPLPGVFSVSATKKVYFSRGNLQYQASTRTWRFAVHQYDYVGDATNGNVSVGETKSNNAQISQSYTGWIDLFGWGTSGFSSWGEGTYGPAFQPWSTNKENSDYGPAGYYGLYDNGSGHDFTNGDWGLTAASDLGAGWRTPATHEWVYLLYTRSASTINGTDNARYAKGKVNGAQGMIIFPDSYTHPSGVTAPTGINGIFSSGWYGNNYSADDWSKMETAGCVFLPAAGYRYDDRNDNTVVGEPGSRAGYWSSTPSTSNTACYFYFHVTSVNPDAPSGRSMGRSVRLVQNL